MTTVPVTTVPVRSGAALRRAALLPLLLVPFLVASCASAPAPPARVAPAAPRPAPPLSAVPGAVVEHAAEPVPQAGRAGSGRASEAGAPSAPPRAADGGQALVIATVAGEPLDVRELLSRWLHHDSPEVHAYLSHLVAARIADLEAERLGVVLDPISIARRVGEMRGELERTVRASGTGMSVERWLRTARGLDPKRYFEVLERDTVSQLQAERVVRAWLFAEGWARVRVILVDDREALAAVRADLAGGEDFADVARARSLDATAENGGLIPALVNNQTSPLSRLAFTTPEGELGGPLEEEGRFLLLRVEQRHEPMAGTWAEIGARVEASLRERPLDESEYRQWEISLDRVYAPDLTPFFELAGEPAL